MAIGTPTAITQGQAQITGGATLYNFTTTGVNITTGNLVFLNVGIVANGTGVHVTGITDGTNNYTKFNAYAPNSAMDCECWFCPNATAVTNPTFAVTISAYAGSALSFIANQCSGLLSSSPQDQSNDANVSSPGASGSQSCTTGTLSTANELVIGVFFQDGGNASGVGLTASGFTNWGGGYGGGASNLTILPLYDIVSSTSSVNFNATWSSAGSPTAQTVTVFTFEGAASSTPLFNMPMLGM